MSFDPYSHWLAIPPDRRPPSHHELLGLAAQEQSPERIREAYAERYASVRRYTLGQNRDAALALLDELSRAFISLSEQTGKQVHHQPGATDVAGQSQQGTAASKSAATTLETLDGSKTALTTHAEPIVGIEIPASPVVVRDRSPFRPLQRIAQLFLLERWAKQPESLDRRRQHDLLAILLLLGGLAYLWFAVGRLWHLQLQPLWYTRDLELVRTGLIYSLVYLLTLIVPPAALVCRLAMRTMRPGYGGSLAAGARWIGRAVLRVAGAVKRLVQGAPRFGWGWMKAPLRSTRTISAKLVRAHWIALRWCFARLKRWLVRDQEPAIRNFVRGAAVGFSMLPIALLANHSIERWRAPQPGLHQRASHVAPGQPLEARCFVIPGTVPEIASTEPGITLVKHAVSDAASFDLIQYDDGVFVRGGCYHLFAISNPGPVGAHVTWIGNCPAAPLISCWNGSEFTRVEQPPLNLRDEVYDSTFHLSGPNDEPFLYVLVQDPYGRPFGTDRFYCVGGAPESGAAPQAPSPPKLPGQDSNLE